MTNLPYALTHEQRRQVIVDYVAGQSSTKLSKKYGITGNSILSLLRRRGIRIRTAEETARKLPLDESVFDEINEQSAYWAGFLMADGNIHIREKVSPCLQIRLAWRDRSHLRKLRLFLRCGHKICIIPRQQNHGFIGIHLGVRSRRLADALALLGVAPRKTARGTCPTLIASRHFWRGMIDGDGCVTSWGLLQLSGNEPNMRAFAAFVTSVIPSFVPHAHPWRGIFQVRFAGANAKFILKHIYNDAQIYLDRKMKIIQGLSSGS